MRQRTLWITVLALLVATSAALAYDSYAAALKDSQALAKAGKFKEAAGAAKRAAELAKKPADKARALSQLGECQLRLRAYADAEKTYRDLVAGEGLGAAAKVAAQYKLGYALYRQGAKKRQEAIAAFGELLNMPGDSTSYKSLAQIYLARLYRAVKQIDKARAAAQWLVDRPKVSSSHKAEGYENLASCLGGEKKNAEAAQLIEKALKTFKPNAYWQGRLQYMIGLFLARANKSAEAVAALEKGAQLEKSHHYWRGCCYVELARIHMKRKDYAKAKADYEALLAIPKVYKSHVRFANEGLARIKKAAAGK